MSEEMKMTMDNYISHLTLSNIINLLAECRNGCSLSKSTTTNSSNHSTITQTTRTGDGRKGRSGKTGRHNHNSLQGEAREKISASLLPSTTEMYHKHKVSKKYAITLIPRDILLLEALNNPFPNMTRYLNFII